VLSDDTTTGPSRLAAMAASTSMSFRPRPRSGDHQRARNKPPRPQDPENKDRIPSRQGLTPASEHYQHQHLFKISEMHEYQDRFLGQAVEKQRARHATDAADQAKRNVRQA
jgi:hypothetical protein